MTTKPHHFVATPELEAAIVEAGRVGERLTLVNHEGRVVGTVRPLAHVSPELAEAFIALTHKAHSDLTEDDEDVLDSVVLKEAIARHAASGEETISLDEIKKSYGWNDEPTEA